MSFILIELNDIGAQVSDILHNDFEYENLLVSSMFLFPPDNILQTLKLIMLL